MIPGYVREATDEETPDWPWINRAETRFVVVDELVDDAYLSNGWRVARPDMRCRHMIGRRSCKRPAVAMLGRGYRPPYQWWGYCDNPEHLFGRRWIDGRLEHVRAVPLDETP